MPTSPSSPSAEGWRIGTGDIAALARGARLLGAGGGGQPRTLALLAATALAGRAVMVAHATKLPQDGLVVAAALVGSPVMLAEQLPRGDEFVAALRGLARHLDEAPVAVMSLEAAGVNVMPALLVAAALDLPVLDVDGMGRAFPRLDHTMFHARGRSAGPMALTGSAGELLVVDVADAVRAERLARVSLAALGGWAANACFPMRVADARRTGLPGGLARALTLGRAAERARSVQELAAAAGGRLVAEGRVLAVERTDVLGPRGWALVEPASDVRATLRLEFQTEYLVAALDGEVVVATPDLIVLVARHGLAPIACEALHRGDEVAVLSVPVDPAWHEPSARALVEPRAFGYAEAA